MHGLKTIILGGLIAVIPLLANTASAACGPDQVEIAATGTCVDRYEASRPDATAVDPGVDTSLAVSASNKIPWTGATYTEAASACAAAGKRLCEPEEWRWACAGDSLLRFPYGNSYLPLRCNVGERYNFSVKPTGSEAQCVGGYNNLYDMSGNVSEWVTSSDPVERRYAGGSFAMPSKAEFQHCEVGGTFTNNGRNDSIGFRCCSNGVPVLPEYFPTCYCSTTDTCCDGCNAINDGTACDDGNPGTENDSCRSGSCVGDCICNTNDYCCDGCHPQNESLACDSGDPAKTCVAGVCQ